MTLGRSIGINGRIKLENRCVSKPHAVNTWAEDGKKLDKTRQQKSLLDPQWVGSADAVVWTGFGLDRDSDHSWPPT